MKKESLPLTLLVTLVVAAVALPAFAGDLKDPSTLNEQAPDVYRAKFETSKGVFVLEIDRSAAPLGADRFYNLVKNGFFDDVRFFRVVPGFVVQFGISGDPELSKIWREARIKDDPVKGSNVVGSLTFATAGPNTRTTQLFINLKANQRLDGMGFAPFGQIVEGMKIVEQLYNGYGDGPPRGRGPNQGRIQAEGNSYLKLHFDKLDYVKTATVEAVATDE